MSSIDANPYQSSIVTFIQKPNFIHTKHCAQTIGFKYCMFAVNIENPILLSHDRSKTGTEVNFFF